MIIVTRNKKNTQKEKASKETTLS